MAGMAMARKLRKMSPSQSNLKKSFVLTDEE